MNYPATQRMYQVDSVPQPPLWYYQPPYYTPLPQQIFPPQPKQHHGDGLLALLVAIGFFFTWVESRRQKAEIRHLHQQFQGLQQQTYTRGITMNQPQPLSSAPSTESTKASATASSFGDGTHFVGENGVQPGIYRVNEPGLRYYVARLRNFTGQNSILANWNGVSPGIIEILPSDAGVEARGGVTWERFEVEKTSVAETR